MSILVKRLVIIGLLLASIWLSFLSWQIVEAGTTRAKQRADVAIVLGAAVYGDRPSPVFEERIKHGVSLYRSGQVGKLLFTGGYSSRNKGTEAIVGGRYAARHGVPPLAILMETQSHTTRENLVNARRVMQANGLSRALIVSDPLHLKRALQMAKDLHMDAEPSPTPTSRFRSLRTKAGFLLRELYFYNHYLLTGQ